MDVADHVLREVLLPQESHAGFWPSIIVDPQVKERLLRSALLGLRLRPALPFEVTALHGLVVLTGPPGTGKTTLARGLGQQLAEFLDGGKCRLIEIDPHGLMSAEHGQSQQQVTALLSEHLPMLADDGVPTIVLLDEVESMAVARSEASLSANPADVHRATDAVLTALDGNAAAHPHMMFVATSNFVTALDDAFLSRADAVIRVPAPTASAATEILRSTLTGMGAAFPALNELAHSAGLAAIGKQLAGTDGRRIRKTVTEALLTRIDTTIDPGCLSLADLKAAVERVIASDEKDRGDL